MSEFNLDDSKKPPSTVEEEKAQQTRIKNRLVEEDRKYYDNVVLCLPDAGESWPETFLRLGKAFYQVLRRIEDLLLEERDGRA